AGSDFSSMDQLDIEIADIQRVGFDELPARLDLVTHEGREDVVRLVRVLDLHLQERAAPRIHRGLPELPRVHLAEALVALYLEPLARLGHHARDRLLQVRDRLGRFALAENERRGARPPPGPPGPPAPPAFPRAGQAP